MLGTHPNCPSKVDTAEGQLALGEYLRQTGAKSMGADVFKHFYDSDEYKSVLKVGDLPFLFKVLSINQALSIQAHPNKQHAAELNKRDPKNYPDPNHKPEMLIAISDNFLALCGFRPSAEIIAHFERYPELVQMCDESNVDAFRRSPNEHELKRCFTALMNKSADFVAEQLERLKGRLATTANKLDSVFLDVLAQYPNDVGCFSIYLLNLIELSKGEAIYLWANVPHAYLLGDGVECMACSDNVVRAGLTPKFKDVNTLCEMLDYGMRCIDENKLKGTVHPAEPAIQSFRPSVDEFSVDEIRVPGNHPSPFLIPRLDSGSILIIVECDAEAEATFRTHHDTAPHPAKTGLVYFIDANNDVQFHFKPGSSSQNTVLLAYRAYCDVKS